nr:myosin-12 isoform X2 [Ipomoea batatas]
MELNLSNLESENQVLRQQALTASTNDDLAEEMEILKSKIKDLESENELLRTQRVVVERVANSDQADSALKQIENGYQVHEDVKTEEVQQVTKLEQQITKDSYPPISLTKQRSLTDRQQASSRNFVFTRSLMDNI